jgi:hypothetical protein
MGWATFWVILFIISSGHSGSNQVCQMVYIFSTQKSQIGLIWQGLAMEDVVPFYGPLVYLHGHLVYFVAMWYSLWYFGLYFHRFGMLYKLNLESLVRIVCVLLFLRETASGHEILSEFSPPPSKIIFFLRN